MSPMCWFVLASSHFTTKYGSVGRLLSVSAAVCSSDQQCKIFALSSWWWQRYQCGWCFVSVRQYCLLSCYHNSNLTDDWLAILQTKSWCDLSLQIQSMQIHNNSTNKPRWAPVRPWIIFLFVFDFSAWSRPEREREMEYNMSGLRNPPILNYDNPLLSSPPTLKPKEFLPRTSSERHKVSQLAATEWEMTASHTSDLTPVGYVAVLADWTELNCCKFQDDNKRQSVSQSVSIGTLSHQDTAKARTEPGCGSL